MSGDWWGEHLRDYDSEHELSSYYGETKKQNKGKYAAIIIPLLLLVVTGAFKRSQIMAFIDDLTSDDTGSIFDKDGSGKPQEQEAAPTTISITPVIENTPTPTPTAVIADTYPNTGSALSESMTHQEIESLPNDVINVREKLKMNNQFMQDAYYTDNQGIRREAHLDSYKPDTFGPYFNALSQSGFNTRERERYDLTVENSLAPEQLLDYFRLQSLTYSQEYLKKLDRTEPINMIDFTADMLSKYHRNFVGIHRSDNPQADDENNAEFNTRLQTYWRDSLFPYVGVDVNSSQYFMNYAEFYMENYPDLNTQITDQNGNLVTINYESLLTGNLSDSDRLNALQALRVAMPEEGQIKLDKNEGSKLVGIMDSVDIAWTNYSQYKYLMTGEIQATPESTATSEPVYEVIATSTPISETPSITPQSTPIPVEQVETNIQRQFANNIPIETGPNRFSDGPVWVVNPNFPHTREILDQIVRPTGLDQLLFPIPSGFRGMGSIPLGAFADYQWGDHHTGTDFIAQEGSSVIAPMNMQLIQIDGDGGYNREGNDPLGLGDHEVIGYFGDYTYTDENGNTIVASLYARFGHMTQSNQLLDYVAEEIGYTPRPHEAIGLWVTAGTEIGRVGNEGYSSTPHLHLEYITSIKSINGQPTDYPNAQLQTSEGMQEGQRSFTPGIRYTQGNDGTWYVQTGNVFETLAERENGSFVTDSSRYQWPFNDNITYIGMRHTNEPTAQADIVPLTYFVQNGEPVNNRIEQFRSSLMTNTENDNRNIQTLRVKNPAQNLRMIYHDTERPHLWLNGASIPLADDSAEARKQYDAFIALMHKSKNVYLQIEKDKTTGKMKISKIAYNQALDPESPPPIKPNKKLKLSDQDHSEIGDKITASREDHASLHASAVTRKYGSDWQDIQVRHDVNTKKAMRSRNKFKVKNKNG